MLLKKYLHAVNNLRTPRITKEMELVLTAGTAALSSTKPKRDFSDVASVARSMAFTDKQSKFLEMKLAEMVTVKRKEILVEDVSKFLMGVGDLSRTRYKIDESFGEETPQAGKSAAQYTSIQRQAAENAYLNQIAAAPYEKYYIQGQQAAKSEMSAQGMQNGDTFSRVTNIV